MRKQDNCWYTTIGRTNHKLGSADQSFNEIEQAYYALMAKGEKPTAITVAWLCERFLEGVESTRAKGTYDWYARYLNCFVAYFGPRLKPENLAPAMVDRWIGTKYGSASQSTQHAAARCIVRVMNWAIAERHIDRPPLVGFQKSTLTSREAYVSPEQYAMCLEHARGEFRDLLIFLWETG